MIRKYEVVGTQWVFQVLADDRQTALTLVVNAPLIEDLEARAYCNCEHLFHIGLCPMYASPGQKCMCLGADMRTHRSALDLRFHRAIPVEPSEVDARGWSPCTREGCGVLNTEYANCEATTALGARGMWASGDATQPAQPEAFWEAMEQEFTTRDTWTRENDLSMGIDKVLSPAAMVVWDAVSSGEVTVSEFKKILAMATGSRQV